MESPRDLNRPDGDAWIGLWIEPLDVLFFRDGRPFLAASRAEGGLPHPRTLAGAVRTALLAAADFSFEEFGRRLRTSHDVKTALSEAGASPTLIEARFRGPWLAWWDIDRPDPLLRAPANLYRTRPEGPVVRADPLPEDVELPGWDPGSEGRRPLWHKAREKLRRVDDFVTLAGIEAFLAGDVPDREHLVPEQRLYGFDQRVGVEIAPESLTGADGRLFARRFVSLEEHVGFYAEVSWPAGARGELEALAAPFPWGGEGRHARARVLERAVAWPEVVPAVGATAAYLLATPGLFRTPERPGPLDPDRLRGGGARVIASASPGPIAVSGWDVARRAPRPTRFAAPAGTVYFVQGSTLPGRAPLGDDPELVAEGWGFALRGVIADDR